MKRKILACLLSLSLLVLTIAPAGGTFASEVEAAPTTAAETVPSAQTEAGQSEEASMPKQEADASTPEPTSASTPEPTLEPVAEFTPEPVSEQVSEVSPEPIPESTPVPMPEDTPEPTPAPTPEPTQEPMPEPTPGPTEEPTPDPTQEPTPVPEGLPELRVKVQADLAGAFEGDEIGASVQISGGLAPYTVHMSVENGGAVTAQETLELETGGSARISAAAAYGTATFSVSVTDALDAAASGSAQTRVAKHAPETQAQWEASLRDVHLSGDWREDMLAIARTQLGYRESDCDFIIDAEGKLKGYTRYGDWYGADYDDWCAMFVAFCLNYAGISRGDYPWSASCESFRGNLRARGAYLRADGYDPQPGDLIFFRDEDGSGAGHMGIVSGAGASSVGVIEGNSANQVRENSYSLRDADILGYASTAELMRQAGILEEEVEADATPAPSDDATLAPTVDATFVPTADATPAPTVDATLAPTADATPAPSDDATSAPTADATPAPRDDATPAPTVDATFVPTADATPVPTVDATLAPTADATPAPSDDATPVPTADATPAPTVDATPVLSADATLAPTDDATPAPTADATPAPTDDATPAPNVDATPAPTADSTPVPVIEEGGTVLVEPSTFVRGEAQLYESTRTVQLSGDADGVQDVTLPQFGMVELSASGSGSAQWQILLPDAQTWVSIAGENSSTLALTYAKIRSLLSGGAASLRCAFGSGDSAAYSATARVTVRYGEAEAGAADVPAVLSIRRNLAAPATFALEDQDEPKATYTAVINYIFESGEVVAEPYAATLAAGSDFSATVPNPTILGYLPYVDGATETAGNVELNITNIQADETHTVVYKPANVNYTVIHCRQNLHDDNYAEYARETLQGLTGSTVPEVAKSYAGFYALLYDRPAIAADGSTVVEVYYDRYYYLMNFDLGGGYGVEPIYARYGAAIGDVGEPIRAGYTFEGWSLGGAAATLPSTMPAENRSYAAVWKLNDAARVTVVFWGENADDDEYSYIKSSEVYVQPETEFTYSEDGTLVCALTPHTHSLSACYALICTQEEHAHTEACYTCGITSHTHGTDCFAGVGDRRSGKPYGAPESPENGQVYAGFWGNRYIYIGGAWYDYTGETESGSIAPTTCGLTESIHVHSDACLGCGKSEHIHSVEGGCYALTCGETEHTHTPDCYMNGAGLDSNLWTFVRSETVTVAPDGSSVVNVYYDRTSFTLTFRANNQTVATITDKWGADISDRFNGAPFSTTYNGRAWECTESSKYSYALQTLDRMPQFDATFNLYNKSSETLKTICYYVENVGANVSESAWPSSAVNFTLLKTVQTYFNYATYDEEYHEIDGFTRYSASIAGFRNNRKDFSDNALDLYYLRNDYVLSFNDGFENVRSETVQYQAPLDAYSAYVPEVPDAYEPGSVSFGGWYLNPECNGEEYILDAHTMPLGNLLLYARWKPVTHSVQFYLNRDAWEQGEELDGYPARSVLHGALLGDVEDPTNGSYVFVGWFCMENGVEKAFDFENMPVTRDLQVYGKWSSNTLKSYVIDYRVLGSGEEVAAPTAGSALAGVTRTFEAKGGDALYSDYREGYFPTVQSHSITIDIEDDENNRYTFWYVAKDAAPYTVRYLDADSGEPVAEEKTVSDNRKAVVTETFVPVSGMMPDAYQKRLVVRVDENGNPDAAHNVIVFYYTKDTVHAYYKITHYTQTSNGSAWTEYASSQAVGIIGERYSASALSIPGFTFDESVSGTLTSGLLTVGGLELKLYYTCNKYPYEVRYLESGSGRQLAESKMGEGRYGSVVSESAIDIPAYEAVAPASQTLTIKIEQSSDAVSLNIITFYYREMEATIRYVVVGPNGCGAVSPESETLKAVTGTAQGSTPAANAGYSFAGWFKDEACTEPVDAAWVDASGKLTPQQPSHLKPGTDSEGELIPDPWVSATYYARFEAAYTSLTIRKSVSAAEENACFVFNVSGNGLDLDVVLQGGGSVTIEGLSVGATYTVKEICGNWRYALDSTNHSVTLEPGGSTVTIANVHDEDQWLDDNAYSENKFSAVTNEGGAQS